MAMATGGSRQLLPPAHSWRRVERMAMGGHRNLPPYDLRLFSYFFVTSLLLFVALAQLKLLPSKVNVDFEYKTQEGG